MAVINNEKMNDKMKHLSTPQDQDKLKKEQDEDQEIAMTMAGNGPNKLVNTFTK